MSDATVHRAVEPKRSEEFSGIVETARRYAPAGPWLDVGCGTGSLLRAASEVGIDISGIELTPSRRALAERTTGCRVYGVPVEDVPIEPGSLAAVTMVNVFSHLISPDASLRRIHDLLVPGGVLVLRTSEAGPDLKRHHSINWILGRHLHFLGKETIQIYCDKIGFELLERESEWQPGSEFSPARFELRGPSKLKNAIKTVALHTPGAIASFRALALRIQRNNPLFISTLALGKR